MVWKRFKLQRTCSWNISRLGLEVVLSPPSQNTSSFRTALTVSVWILSHLPHQKASPCRLQDPGCHLCTISTNPPFTVEALHVWSCQSCLQLGPLLEPNAPWPWAHRNVPLNSLIKNLWNEFNECSNANSNYRFRRDTFQMPKVGTVSVLKRRDLQLAFAKIRFSLENDAERLKM